MPAARSETRERHEATNRKDVDTHGAVKRDRFGKIPFRWNHHAGEQRRYRAHGCQSQPKDAQSEKWRSFFESQQNALHEVCYSTRET